MLKEGKQEPKNGPLLQKMIDAHNRKTTEELEREARELEQQTLQQQALEQREFGQ
jgi:hypothetical protein